MTLKYIHEARRLVDLYHNVQDGLDFAAELAAQPPLSCESAEARIDFAWQLIDTAFDDGYEKAAAQAAQ